MKKTNTTQSSELLHLFLLGSLIIFLISLPIKNVLASISLTITYILFFYVPLLPLIDNINIGFIEKFVLANVAGLSYTGIYILLDVFFNIPLSIATYLIVTIILIIVLWLPKIRNLRSSSGT